MTDPAKNRQQKAENLEKMLTPNDMVFLADSLDLYLPHADNAALLFRQILHNASMGVTQLTDNEVAGIKQWLSQQSLIVETIRSLHSTPTLN